MIDKLIESVSKELTTFLDRVAGLEGDAKDKISIAHLFNASGEVEPTDIGITLVNIEEERVNRSVNTYLKTQKGTVKVNPEIKLNVFFLFSANFQNNYKEALKFIAYIIRFFQSKNVFTPENTPGLEASIEKLIVEMVPMSFEQQNYLWGMLGGKYIPSVLYKFRLLVVQEETPIDPVKEIDRVHIVNA